MMKVFSYQGVDYQSEKSVRRTIFNTKRLALPKVREEDWERYGVTVKYVVEEPSAEELAKQARMKRDSLLARCDYYVMPDYPATEEGLEEVKIYRQALRDITKRDGFPHQIVWPTVPEVL